MLQIWIYTGEPASDEQEELDEDEDEDEDLLLDDLLGDAELDLGTEELGFGDDELPGLAELEGPDELDLALDEDGGAGGADDDDGLGEDDELGLGVEELELSAMAGSLSLRTPSEGASPLSLYFSVAPARGVSTFWIICT